VWQPIRQRWQAAGIDARAGVAASDIDAFERRHGVRLPAEVRARYGVDMSAALASLERCGDLVRGELRPGGNEREWCDPEVLRRLSRASLAVLRREIEAVEPPALARFIDRPASRHAQMGMQDEIALEVQQQMLPSRLDARDGTAAEALRPAVGAFGPAGWPVELGCPATPEAVFWAVQAARNAARVPAYAEA